VRPYAPLRAIRTNDDDEASQVEGQSMQQKEKQREKKERENFF